jgi:hypothetical protein
VDRSVNRQKQNSAKQFPYHVLDDVVSILVHYQSLKALMQLLHHWALLLLGTVLNGLGILKFLFQQPLHPFKPRASAELPDIRRYGEIVSISEAKRVWSIMTPPPSQYTHASSNRIRFIIDERINDELESGGLDAFNNLLHHMIPVLVFDALQHLPLHFSQQLQLLCRLHRLNGLLDHPTAIPDKRT